MKKTNYLLLLTLVITGFFISCDKKEEEPDIQYEAEMITFGFYQEDNQDVIYQDYLIETITGAELNFLLPEEIDKSALIARFTTTDGDEVKVNGVLQESGKTVNDFTVPVDYIVSEGTANMKYTVTVADAPAYVWNPMSPYADDLAKDLLMKINKKDGNPYFVYKKEREESDDEGIAFLTIEDETWKSLGDISDGRIGSYFDFTFNSEGTPYVSYADYTADVKNAITVKKYNSSSWSLVGDRAFTAEKLSYHSLAFVNDDKLVLAGTFDGRNGPLSRRELAVNFFEANAWTINTTIPGRSTDLIGYLVKTVKKGDDVYVGAHNAVRDDNSISVHKYNNNGWETVVDKWRDPDATAISVRGFDIAVDKDDNIYIGLSDNSSAGEEKLRVVKYDAVTKTIENVGNPIPSAVGGSLRFDLAVSPFGIPFLAFRNDSKFPSVVTIDKNTKDWTSAEVLETSEVDDISIDFAADGTGYISYLKDKVIVIHKYSAPK